MITKSKVFNISLSAFSFPETCIKNESLCFTVNISVNLVIENITILMMREDKSSLIKQIKHLLYTGMNMYEQST